MKFGTPYSVDHFDEHASNEIATYLVLRCINSIFSSTLKEHKYLLAQTKSYKVASLMDKYSKSGIISPKMK